MKRIFCSLAVFLLLIAFSGCATTRSGAQPSELQERIDNLESRLDQVEKGQTQLEKLVVNQVPQQSREKIVLSKEIIDNFSNKDIQTALKNAGYYIGDIDGKIGPKTREAIMEFQKDHGLKVDGVVGRNTWEILSEYYN
jgi:murein L,D-transpeptidase YcbB/YkuD